MEVEAVQSRQSRDALARSVKTVADDRPARCGQVNANLMGPAGCECAPRPANTPALPRKRRKSLAASLPFAETAILTRLRLSRPNGHLETHPPAAAGHQRPAVTQDLGGVVGVFRHCSLHERPVRFADFPRLELLLQQPVRAVVLGHQQYPASQAVQAVNDSGRSSPDTLDKLSKWCSSALTSVPDAAPAPA